MFASPIAKPQATSADVSVSEPTHPSRRAHKPGATRTLPVVPASRLPGFVQPELTVGAVDDPLEREADRVSDQVASHPGKLATASGPPRIQGDVSPAERRSDTAPASVASVLGGAGKPLDAPLLQDMEQRIGHDFSRVRVHAGAAAQQSARDMGANAYAVGTNSCSAPISTRPGRPKDGGSSHMS